ncbi:MAG: rhodanese-like domain-containing protein [Bacteroidota bacterium]
MLDFLKKMMGGRESVDLAEWIEKGAVIIDVRSPAEYRGGHVKGSRNIPLNTISTKIEQIQNLNRPVITCCASGARSGSAASILRRAGIEVVNGGPWQKVAPYV